MTETWLLLVRHPETAANMTGCMVGRGDSPFTEKGRGQAERLPDEIVAFAPDEIWTSPLRRAHVVAQHAATDGHLPLVVDERLQELDFGEAEGLTWEEIEEAGIAFNFRSADDPVAPGGESRAQIELRTAEVCDELVARGGRFALVAHGGVVRAAIVHLLGLAPEAIWAFHIHNAQLAVVRVVEGHGMLEEYREG